MLFLVIFLQLLVKNNIDSIYIYKRRKSLRLPPVLTKTAHTSMTQTRLR